MRSTTVRGRSLFAALAVIAGATALSVLGTLASAQAPPSVSSAASASAESTAPSAEPSGSAAPAGTSEAASAPPPVRVRSDRVVSYTLSAELDPEKHSVRGKGTLTWRNTSRVATDKLYVHLYLNAFKNDRTVFWRVPIAGFRGDPLDGNGHIDVERFYVRELGKDLWPENPTTPGDPEDATDIEVKLPRAIEPGESLTIEMAWTSQLPTVTLRTGYSGSFHMVAQWFPKVARLEEDGTWAHFPFYRLSEFYADFGSYDVTVTAPERFVVGAVGSLASEGPVAEAGEEGADKSPRTARRFRAFDVHDFAFVAWDKFRSLTDTSPGGVKITCLFPDGYDAMARAEIDAARFGLGYLGAAFGDYPYETLTIVHPPRDANEAGGMEYPTMITTGGSWTRGPIDNHGVEILTLHELAHQWFYGLVASNEHASPFLDEGLTSYAEMDAAEAMWPDASVSGALGARFALYAAYRAGALEATRHARVSDPVPSFVSGGDYGALIYSRTSTTLRSLGNVYGLDTVRRAVGRYARRYRFAHPTPEDFFTSMGESLGSEAEEALRTALTELSSVDYIAERVDSEQRTDGKLGYVGHALVRRLGTIRLPVDVLLIADDGTRTIVRWDARSAAAQIPYEGDSPLRAAVIDPDHRVLLDEDLANNAIYRNGEHRFAWRVLEGASFFGGVLSRGALP